MDWAAWRRIVCTRLRQISLRMAIKCSVKKISV
jgi:hypothetical protein